MKRVSVEPFGGAWHALRAEAWMASAGLPGMSEDVQEKRRGNPVGKTKIKEVAS